ncbi:MAG: radical SAM protein [Candidatus Buchananbacteria bacterium]|nr:radical SAM protein [Candidatus Buchananbacteria bacterium]
MSRVDIKIGFACNNMCQFCVQGDKRFKFKNRTLNEIKKALKTANAQGSQGVVFTGGEPTLHDNILEAVKYANDLGFQSIQLQTNGRMLAYFGFCQKLIKAGINEFSPALHASIPQIHDELTSSPGAWEQVVQGIKNLKLLNQFVLTNTVITSKNYKDLPALAKLFIDLGVDQFQFAFVHILGSAAQHKDWLVPQKSEIMPYVKKGLDVGIKANKRVMTEAIPYCLMTGYEDYIAEKIMPETQVVDAEGVIASYAKYRHTEGKVKSKECETCKYFKICEGPWKEYPEIYGWNEFIPIKKLSINKKKQINNNFKKNKNDIAFFNFVGKFNLIDFKEYLPNLISFKIIKNEKNSYCVLLKNGDDDVFLKTYRWQGNKFYNFVKIYNSLSKEINLPQIISISDFVVPETNEKIFLVLTDYLKDLVNNKDKFKEANLKLIIDQVVRLHQIDNVIIKNNMFNNKFFLDQMIIKNNPIDINKIIYYLKDKLDKISAQGLCHFVLKPEHFIFNKNKVYMIDLDNISYDYLIFDLAALIERFLYKDKYSYTRKYLKDFVTLYFKKNKKVKFNKNVLYQACKLMAYYQNGRAFQDFGPLDEFFNEL